MKKMILSAIFMIALGGALSAQTTKAATGNPGTNKNNPGYVDANKNAVCDNYENNTRRFARKGPGNRCGAGNGNGQCPTAKQGKRNGCARKG